MLSPIEPWRLDVLLGEDGPLEGRFRLERDMGCDDIGQRFSVLDLHTGRGAVLRVLLAQEDIDARNAIAVYEATRITHPKVAEPLAWGTLGPLVYIVYKRVAGQRLETLLAQRGALSLRELVPVLSQILMPVAILHAHGRAMGGLVLRDVVLRRHLGRAHFVKLEDFAVRAAFAAARRRETSIRQDVAALGQIFLELLPEHVASDSLPEILPGILDVVHGCVHAGPDSPGDAHAIMERLIDRIPSALFRLPADEEHAVVHRPTASMSAISVEAVLPCPLEGEDAAKPRGSRVFRSIRRLWVVTASAALLSGVGVWTQAAETPEIEVTGLPALPSISPRPVPPMPAWMRTPEPPAALGSDPERVREAQDARRESRSVRSTSRAHVRAQAQTARRPSSPAAPSPSEGLFLRPSGSSASRSHLLPPSKVD